MKEVREQRETGLSSGCLAVEVVVMPQGLCSNLLSATEERKIFRDLLTILRKKCQADLSQRVCDVADGFSDFQL